MAERKMIYLDDAVKTIESFYRVDSDILRKMTFELKELPSAQPDLSGYSDRLWKRAYDRGYEWCRQDAIEAVEMLLEQSEDDEHDKIWNNAIRGAINAVKHHLPSVQPDDFLEFLWNVINPNEMQGYLEMYWSGEEEEDENN